jgi:MFS family permease
MKGGAPSSSLAGKTEFSNSIVRLGAGYFCVFMAFNTTQALISTLVSDKQLAYATLGVLYGVFTATSFVAPKIVDRVGPRLAISGGALFYVAFVFCNIYPVWATLLPASAGVGFGAAVLWTGQGIYLSRCAVREAALTGEPVDDVTSRMNGTFWTMFQFNAAVGLCLSSIILGRAQAGAFALADAVKWMFTGFGALGLGGVAVFFSLKNAPPMDAGERAGGDAEDGEGAKSGAAPASAGATFLDTIRLIWSNRAMQLLLPAIFYTGASLGFFGATFPLVYQDTATTHALLPSSYVGYQAATFYLANSFFSFAFGKFVVPRIGRRPLFLVTFASAACFFALLALRSIGLIAFAHESAGAYIFVFGLSVLFAAGDSVLESQVPAIIQSPTFFPVERDRDAANSVLRMMQSLGYCAQFGISIFASCASGSSGCTLQAGVLAALMVLALGSLWACDRFVRSIDSSSKAGNAGADVGSDYAAVPADE